MSIVSNAVYLSCRAHGKQSEKNNNIKLLKMVGSDLKLKLLQYADDTLFFVADETSLKGI